MNTVQFGDVNVELAADDVELLTSNGWLNDKLIEFFMCKRARASRPGCHIAVVTAHWCSTVLQRRTIAYVAELPDYVNDALQSNYLGAQTIHRDLLRNEFILMPVNVHSDHWILIVIWLYTKQVDNADSPPWGHMFVYDSLPDSRSEDAYRACASALRAFLNCEWYFHYVRAMGKDEHVFDDESLPMHVMRMTRQRNHHDCGCYVIRACESFLGEIPNIVSSVDEGSVRHINDLLKGKLSLGRNFRNKLREEIGIVVEKADDDESDDSDLVMSWV